METTGNVFKSCPCCWNAVWAGLSWHTVVSLVQSDSGGIVTLVKSDTLDSWSLSVHLCIVGCAALVHKHTFKTGPPNQYHGSLMMVVEVLQRTPVFSECVWLEWCCSVCSWTVNLPSSHHRDAYRAIFLPLRRLSLPKTLIVTMSVFFTLHLGITAEKQPCISLVLPLTLPLTLSLH